MEVQPKQIKAWVTDRKAEDKYYCSQALQMKARDSAEARNCHEPHTKGNGHLPELTHQHRWHQ
ncbi:MAG: hypothetical protein RL615_1304 [Pseudomonadota bacterium]